MTRSTIRVALIAALLVAASPPVAAASPPSTSVKSHPVDTAAVPFAVVEHVAIRFVEVTMPSVPSYSVSKRTQRWVQDGALDQALRRSCDRRSRATRSTTRSSKTSTAVSAGSGPSPLFDSADRLVLTALNDIDARNRGSTA